MVKPVSLCHTGSSLETFTLTFWDLPPTYHLKGHIKILLDELLNSSNNPQALTLHQTQAGHREQEQKWMNGTKAKALEWFRMQSL